MSEAGTAPTDDSGPTGDPDATDAAAQADDETAETPAFANRAERRAKGRGKSSAPSAPHGKGGFPGGRGSVQSPRQYGNRRSG